MHQFIDLEYKGEKYIGHNEEWCHVPAAGPLTYINDSPTVNALKRMYWVHTYTHFLKLREELNTQRKEVSKKIKRSILNGGV